VAAVINNPTWTGGLTDPSGQSVGQAMNGIASAFMNTAQGDVARAALQAAQQKQAAVNNISDVFGKYNDASQDYAQDAPDYSTPQPPPRIDLSDPAAFARSLITLGNPAEIGKSLQLASAIQGGVNAPGVGVGSIPGGGYAQTPEGIAGANQLAIQKSAADAQSNAAQKPYVAFDSNGTPIVTNEANAAAGRLPAGATPPVSTDQQKAAQLNRLVFNPAVAPAPSGDEAATTPAGQPAPTADQRIAMGLDSNKSTPYNISWVDASGTRHNMVSTDPATDIASQNIGQFNPTVGGTTGSAGNVHVVGTNLVDPTGKVLFSATPGATLDPVTIDQLAQRSVLGDNSGLVGLGRGAQGAANLVAVQNRAAQVAVERGLDPQGVLDNIAAFGGEKAGARTVGQLGAKLDVFGTSANAALDYAASKSAMVPRGQWLPVNQVQQMIQRGSNDPNLAMLNAATETAVNEYTRAIGLSGASTDTAKAHAYAMLNTAQSPEAYQAVVNGLKFEIDNLHRATQGARAGINHSGAPAPEQPQQPAAGASPQGQQPTVQGPLPGARQAPDGNWYVPNPSQPGGYLRVDAGGQQ
jgi:hypothetical protein